MAVDRVAELADNLADVRSRIEAAALAAGRSPQDVHLIAVTKTWPLSDIRILADLGLRDFGESRDQEASRKVAEWREIDGRDVVWHFIGQLQSNKAKSVASYASVVHTVDRPSLVDALLKAGQPLDCLLQLSIDGDVERGGCPGDELLDLAARVRDPLRLRGIMAVAPLGMDPAAAFEIVGGVHTELLAVHPQAGIRCIGMSDDFEAAIAAGATHVRIGSALLGNRPPAH